MAEKKTKRDRRRSAYRGHNVLATGPGVAVECDYVSVTLGAGRTKRTVEIAFDVESDSVRVRCLNGRLVIKPDVSNSIYVDVDNG